MIKRFLKGPATILALASFAVAAAPVAGVMTSNAALAAETAGQTRALDAAPRKAEMAPAGRRRLNNNRRLRRLKNDRRRRRLNNNNNRRRHRRFRLRRVQPRRIAVPISFTCVVEKDWTEGGGAAYPIIRIINTGSVAIPAGRTFRWQLSTGHTGTIKLYHPLAPGQSSMPDDSPFHTWIEGLTCQATTLQVRYHGPRFPYRRIN